MSKQISLDLESIRNIDRTIRSLQESLEDGENDLRNKHDNLTSLLDELSRNPDLAEFLFSQRCKLNLLKVSSEIFHYCKESIEGCEKIAKLLPIDRLENLPSLQDLSTNNFFVNNINSASSQTNPSPSRVNFSSPPTTSSSNPTANESFLHEVINDTTFIRFVDQEDPNYDINYPQNYTVGTIKARPDVNDPNRIFIVDTDVAGAYKRKGIGRKLFERLEKQFSEATEFYFATNDAPEFWAKMGFEKRDKSNEYGSKSEFYKKNIQKT